ncbi:MAG: zinc ribbon domain-containing protein [Planctomycetes bacterium]|nr:zinc ribbon domain-containing protein [Planctomycetota bacterium]
MPTYEYECDACGHTMEMFQSITDKSIRKCPKCKKLKLRRLIGAGAGIIFKGSGFYETDYRSKDYEARARQEKTGDSTSSSKSESKSDTKSDSKDPKKNGGNGKD